MRQLDKILVSFLLVMTCISGTESIEGGRALKTGDGDSEYFFRAPADRRESDSDLGVSGKGTRMLIASNADGVDVADRNVYARWSPDLSIVPNSARGLAFDDDWILAIEPMREDDFDDDSVFYAINVEAVVEPGAMAVLGVGLIGLFAIIRHRFRKQLE